MTTSNDPLLQAFLRVEETIRAVPEGELRPINLDLATLSANIFGALQRVEPLRAEIAALPRTDHALLAQLPDLVSALRHLQGELASLQPLTTELAAAAEEGAELLEAMVADARALIARKRIPAASLEGLLPGNGYRILADNLNLVASMARRHLSTIEGVCGITAADVDRAKVLSELLVREFGERTNSGADQAALATLRSQAYTLAVRGYEELRIAVAYVRGRSLDGDAFTPSLWAGRGGRRTKEEPTPVADGRVPAPLEAPTPTPLQEEAPLSDGSPFR